MTSGQWENDKQSKSTASDIRGNKSLHLPFHRYRLVLPRCRCRISRWRLSVSLIPSPTAPLSSYQIPLQSCNRLRIFLRLSIAGRISVLCLPSITASYASSPPLNHLSKLFLLGFFKHRNYLLLLQPEWSISRSSSDSLNAPTVSFCKASMINLWYSLIKINYKFISVSLPI